MAVIFRSICMLGILLGGAVSLAKAQPYAERVDPRIGKAAAFANQYPISKLKLVYGPRKPGFAPHPDLPSIETLYTNVVVSLRNTEGTGFVKELYVAPEKKHVTREVSLRELNLDYETDDTKIQVHTGRIYLFLNKSDLQKALQDRVRPEVEWKSLSGDALVAIGQAIVSYLNQLGFYGVWVAPDSADINPETGEDERGRTDLTLVIYAAEIQQVRTVARGKRFAEKNPINLNAHKRILTNSPLKGEDKDLGRRGSLFQKAKLDEYLARLNRFPGRRVDGALSTSEEYGNVVADYIVTEDRSWLIFSQISNTGTEASGDWRERFGFMQQQLTNNDDILSLDYVTANFDESHAFFSSYEFPIVFPDKLKTKVYGSYGQYDADDIALSLQSFEGYSWSAGAEVTWSPFQVSEFHLGKISLAPLYFDFGLGAKWQAHRVDKVTFEMFKEETSTDLFIPYVNFHFTSISQEARFSGGIQFETNLSGLAGTGDEDLGGLGRVETDDDWVLAKWGVGLSFFLEPMFSEDAVNLVHELSFTTRGQYTFGHQRLIPQQQELIGGFHSVRGYPEAFDLGDSTFIGTAEYHFYVLRALFRNEPHLAVGAKTSVQSQFANPFRFRPKDVYGRPNEDLIFRAFIDVGSTRNNDTKNNKQIDSQSDQTLLSTGLGLEFSWKRHVNLRLDYGIALKDENYNQDAVPIGAVEAGDSEIHFSATIGF